GVSLRSPLGAERAAFNFNGVVRPATERSQCGTLVAAECGVSPPEIVRALAATKIGIGSRFRVPVEALHRLVELSGIDTHSLRKLRERVGAGDPAGRSRFSRSEPITQSTYERPLGVERLVEDQPAGQVGIFEPADILFVERRAERVVVGGFVGESLAK